MVNKALAAFFSILSILLTACNFANKESSNKDTITNAAGIDSIGEIVPDLVEVRNDFINSYNLPVEIDTFFYAGHKRFDIHFKHSCSFDSALIIPAKYNFDTDNDFRTHNFKSDLMLMSGTDTIFKRAIEKLLFERILNPEQAMYGTLLYSQLNLQNDSIAIRYSISIPVTDVGVSAEIKFDTLGKFSIY